MPIPRSTNRLVWLDAQEAVRRLGVKRATLYTYASRGWVRTRSDGGRSKRYHAADIERLAERSAAHGGRGPRAAGALSWGEPVLTTQVSAIDADGPYYRGVPALDLLETPLAELASLLWGTDAPAWPEVAVEPGKDLLGMRRLVDRLASEDPDRAIWSAATEQARAARIVASLHAAAGLPRDPDVHAALVLTADHGLNASTFTARVIASTGADLYAAVSGALAALSGPRHGTASQQVYALLERFEDRGPAALREAARETGGLPGFGHPLYPAGDPRGEALIRRARCGRIDSLCKAVAPLGLLPNLDVGLLAVCLERALDVGAAARMFAVGRSIGWVAHIFEQRTQPGLLRPRAHYGVWQP